MYQQFKAQLLAANKQVGTNPQNMGECVGEVQLFWQRLGLPFFFGNACDLPANAPRQFFDVYKYQPGFALRQGDAVVWFEYAPLGIGVNGHVDLCDIPGIVTFIGLDQNWHLGHAPELIGHTMQGVRYIIRAKKLEVYVMDADDAKWMYKLGVNRDLDKDQVSTAEIQGNVGKKPSDAEGQMCASSEWLRRNYYATEGPGIIAGLTTKIQALQAAPTQDEINQLKQEVSALQTTINSLPGAS